MGYRQEIPLEIQCKNKLLKLNNLRAKQGKQSLGMYKDIVGQNKFNSLEEFDLYLMDYMTQKQ